MGFESKHGLILGAKRRRKEECIIYNYGPLHEIDCCPSFFSLSVPDRSMNAKINRAGFQKRFGWLVNYNDSLSCFEGARLLVCDAIALD